MFNIAKGAKSEFVWDVKIPESGANQSISTRSKLENNSRDVAISREQIRIKRGIEFE